MSDRVSRIFLDMDGVIVDFMRGLLGALEVKGDPYQQPENRGKWSIEDVLHLPPQMIWSPCNHHDFWADLDWTADGLEILASATRLAGESGVYLLSSPTLSPHCWSGKAAWVDRCLPEFRRRLLFGACKHVCAYPGNVLIDDYDYNVEQFRAAGGTAILVPRPWNSAHHQSHAAAGVVWRQLQEISG